MSTSEPSGPGEGLAGADRALSLEDAGAVAKEIERLANQFFAGVARPTVDALSAFSPQGPAAPTASAPTPGAIAPGTPPLGPVAPPQWGPSALGVGAGGTSPAASLPPVPGPVKEPPLPAAPPPKESDFQVVPGTLSDALGLASPVVVATSPEPAGGRPYFLEWAGLPAAISGAPVTDPRWPASAHRGSLGESPLAAWSSAIAPAALTGPVAESAGPLADGDGPSDPGILGGSAPLAAPIGRPTVRPSDARVPPTALRPEGDLREPAVGVADGLGFSLPLSLPGTEAPAAELYFLSLASGPPSSGTRPERSLLLGQPSIPSTGPGLPSRPSVPLSVPGAAAAVPSQPPATLAQAPASPAPPVAASDFRPELVPDVRAPLAPFDGATIKRDFPILEERVRGRPLVWLDNAATTQKPRVVIERLSYYYEHENSNVHRAAHALAARATDAYEGARDTVRRFLNAPSAQDIVFVRGTTEAINLVAKSWGERYVAPGDEVVITWLEHHANIVPWQQLCADKGACLRVAPVDDRGQVILEQYERLLGPRTRLVSFSHVSNALGTIVPAREMIEMAHRHGALVLVDGAQAVAHRRVDVQALDCDFYCFSGHKIFAPTGIGVLYGKRDVLNSMPPWQGGGNMISNVTFEKTSYQPPPQRFEAGTSSIGDAVGLGAALDYVSSLGMENITRYEHELLVHATEGLARVPGLRMIGTAPDKAAVLSFVLDGIRTEDVGAALDQEGIAVRSGHHCAQPILRRFGVESTVRASLAPYNTREDIDALVAALLRLQVGRPQLRASSG